MKGKWFKIFGLTLVLSGALVLFACSSSSDDGDGGFNLPAGPTGHITVTDIDLLYEGKYIMMQAFQNPRGVDELRSDVGPAVKISNGRAVIAIYDAHDANVWEDEIESAGGTADEAEYMSKVKVYTGSDIWSRLRIDICNDYTNYDDRLNRKEWHNNTQPFNAGDLTLDWRTGTNSN